MEKFEILDTAYDAQLILETTNTLLCKLFSDIGEPIKSKEEAFEFSMNQKLILAFLNQTIDNISLVLNKLEDIQREDADNE